MRSIRGSSRTFSSSCFLLQRKIKTPALPWCSIAARLNWSLILVNRLRKLENAETAIYLRGGDFNVLSELRRVGQRQFHWQRGYLNAPQFYRYAFMYAQGKCGEYFEKANGLSIAELNFVAFALYVHSMRSPWISRTFMIPELKLTADLMKRALPLLLISADLAREETKKIVDGVNAKHGRGQGSPRW